MATTVLPLLKVGGMQLFKMDASGTEKILPKTVEVSFFLWFLILYLSHTALLSWMFYKK